jgi:cold-inducible RNA-binding protein
MLLSGRRSQAAAPFLPKKEGFPMSVRIYVGNLPLTATEDQLHQVFAAYGALSEVTIIRDRDSGQNKGFGFVQMADDAAARTAIAELNGTMLDDRALRVNEAQARTERTGSYDRRR